MDWKKKSILITGGTGSFGKKCISLLLREFHPKKVIVFSRDELKQHEMRQSGFTQENLRYFIGDVRDERRLHRAMDGVDIVIHAAALKQVPACEYNPIEAIQTNVIGTKNVVEVAIDRKVERALFLSSDKAVSPINIYGATKLCGEKLFVQSNAYSGSEGTKFACVRYGNVVGSRGSIVEVIAQQKPSGTISLTDPRMSRFWLTLDRGVRFVLSSIEQMQGGEVFVPKIPSMKLIDLAKTLAPECQVKYIGIRIGEKLHEALLSEDESRLTIELSDRYVIRPTHAWWSEKSVNGKPVTESMRYSSDQNTLWLTGEDLKALLSESSESSIPKAA